MLKHKEVRCSGGAHEAVWGCPAPRGWYASHELEVGLETIRELRKGAIPGRRCAALDVADLALVDADASREFLLCQAKLTTPTKDLGGEPKNVDWIIWLWKQRPHARWE